MTVTPNTSQLSTFTIIRDIINSDAILNPKFNISSGNIYNWDPKWKASGMKFPYIVARIPETTATDLLVMDHNSTIKQFEVTIMLVMEWLARDNFITYANALVRAIESNEQTFMGYGYNNVIIELINIDPDFIKDEKECVAGTFTLTLTGNVYR